jgi:Kef-type K+ transport system membrane component KefB
MPMPVFLTPLLVHASAIQTASEGGGGEPSHGAGITLLWIAVILLAAKISSLVERFGQPSVLGELVIGVILGNLVLVGFNIFEPIKEDAFINFLSQLGVVILLFQVGLETEISEMRKVGVPAFLVAIIGVVAPFVLGTYMVGPWLMPGLDPNAYLFLGATLTATSVGITARVFRDMGRLQDREAQIILGAAVIDDVLGLIILAVVSAIVTMGTVDAFGVGFIILKAVVFLGAAILVGQTLSTLLSKWLSKIQNSTAMMFTLAISFGLALAYLAEFIGLAPIVGAFAAGLVLDPVHFRHFFEDPQVVNDVKESLEHSDSECKQKVLKVMEHHADRHVEEIIEPVSMFLVPIFFVYTGMGVKLETMFDIPVLLVALAITVAAVIGKIVAGLAAGKVNKWVVGWGMVPRGEVGLIFAATGKALGVVNDEVFSIIVIMVIFSTLLPPPVLAFLLKKKNDGTGEAAAA